MLTDIFWFYSNFHNFVLSCVLFNWLIKHYDDGDGDVIKWLSQEKGWKLFKDFAEFIVAKYLYDGHYIVWEITWAAMSLLQNTAVWHWQLSTQQRPFLLPKIQSQQATPTSVG